MKFGIFYEHQLPRPWAEDSEYRLLQNSLTQIELAKKVGETQSFISKCERGERRIDVIELRRFCQAFGMSFRRFIADLEKALHRRL